MSEYEAEYKAVDKQEKVVKRSGFGVASLVLGIIGICISFIPIVNYLSFVLGLLALIFGIVSLIKKASKGMATAGLILGILAIIVAYNIHTVFSNVLKEVLENNTIEEIKPQKEDNVVDPMDSVIKLDPNYNQMLEEARGIDLKTAINEIRDLVQKMEEQGFSLSLDEIDLADKYQMTINIQKSE